MLYRHIFDKISCEICSILHVFVNFAGFCGLTWNSRLSDHAKYQKPWYYEVPHLHSTNWQHLHLPPPCATDLLSCMSLLSLLLWFTVILSSYLYLHKSAPITLLESVLIKKQKVKSLSIFGVVPYNSFPLSVLRKPVPIFPTNFAENDHGIKKWGVHAVVVATKTILTCE